MTVNFCLTQEVVRSRARLRLWLCLVEVFTDVKYDDMSSGVNFGEDTCTVTEGFRYGE